MEIVGKRIDGRYEVHAFIGEDNIFQSYRCTDIINNQLVILKIFKKDLFHNIYTRNIKDELNDKLHELKKVDDPSIQKLLDYSLGDTFQYVVCEFVDDISLERFLVRKTDKYHGLGWEDIKTISKKICEAVKILHNSSIIHGSISPSVVLMRRKDGFDYPYEVKLADSLYRSFVDWTNVSIVDVDKQKLIYDAPEIALNGVPLSFSSDIYSIGVILYKLIEGKIPFESEDNVTILVQKKKRITISNEQIPKGFCQIVEHALEPKIVDRYDSVVELCDDLNNLIANESLLFDFKIRKRIGKRKNGMSSRKKAKIINKSIYESDIKNTNAKYDNHEKRKSEHIINNSRIGEKKMDYKFRCPYCFTEMSHTEVLFRGVTTFRDDEFDASGRGRHRSDIEIIQDDAERNKLLKEYAKREFFSAKKDDIYHNWYSDHNFGKTSENPGNGEVPVYDRPIIKPNDHGTSDLIYDEDGFAIELRDPWNEPTRERVCKKCHNPLPLGYGKYPVRYISVIGISGAGKTVYLSKLIQNISEYTAHVKLATTPSPSSVEFVRKNPVKEGAQLPIATFKSALEQPLSYNIKFGDGKNETFVIYDIAGENCEIKSDLLKYGKFVINSDGIILLIDPVKELGINGGEGDNKLDIVLDNINDYLGKKGLNDIPLAVCISKSDLMKETLVSEKFFDKVRTEKYKFCAEDYNEISKELSDFMNETALSTKMKLNAYYSRYNFFAFTALGCSTKITYMNDEFGNEYEAEIPKNPPNPKRIEEPLFWLFTQFGYVKSTGPIYTPKNEEAIENRKEKSNEIKELQSQLDKLPKICFKSKDRREKERLDLEITKLQKEISQLDQEIKQFSQ